MSARSDLRADRDSSGGMDLIKEVKQIGDITIVYIAGRFDAASAASVKQKLLSLIEDGCTRLVLNLSETTFIDSSGLGVLVSCLRRVSGLDGDLKLACVPPPARSIFELTRLSRVFELDDDEESATAKLNRL